MRIIFLTKILGKSVERVYEFDQLGVTIDDKLNWSRHIEKLYKKLSSASSSSLSFSITLGAVGAVGGYCFPVGAVGGYCFPVGVYCEWIGAIVLFVYSIVCE